MDKVKVISERNYESWPSYFVVYEWEDVFSHEGIHLKIINYNLLYKFWRKIKGNISDKFERKFKSDQKQYNLKWIMDAQNYRRYAGKNIIPIFLDFPFDMVDKIKTATASIPFYWVTCLDIYEALREAGSRNVHFMPLSISDRYYTGQVPDKTIDVIQFGRKNKILHEFMMEYCKKYPGTEYVYQTNDGSLTYESTIRGNIGKFDRREEYFQLMSGCKVSLVSSPGIDSSRNFGTVDFITPRFYESAVNYCYMIGRYTDNKEARMIGIDKVCTNVDSFKIFEKKMNEYLSSTHFELKNTFDEFLNNNLTSKRVQNMMDIIMEFL